MITQMRVRQISLLYLLYHLLFYLWYKYTIYCTLNQFNAAVVNSVNCDRLFTKLKSIILQVKSGLIHLIRKQCSLSVNPIFYKNSINFVAVRNNSCGKVMFSRACIIPPAMHGGGCMCGGACMAGNMATAADSTHPTGMHSCSPLCPK